ncbi:uncharacterized protein LOC141977195 [Natator depressus]|uniref:uncharacterized protein LOC141977195 n=1 Tax=Natator depressus TaxID=27790 RepID=UPI003EB7FD68
MNSSGGDPTSTAKSTVDTLTGLEPVESGPNQRRKSLMKRWRLKKRWSPMMRPVRSCSPLRTCLASVCSRPLASQKQERRPLFTTALPFIVNYASPDFTLRTNPPTAAEPLCKIRKRLRWTKEDMFRMVLQQSEVENTERKKLREREKQEREEKDSYKRGATERLIKVLERQTDMLQTLAYNLPYRHRQHTFNVPYAHSIDHSAPTQPVVEPLLTAI